MADGYATHGELLGEVEEEAQIRCEELRSVLRDAFADRVRVEEHEVISFVDLTVSELANAIIGFPTVLKPLLLACNIAARAIERDLGLRNLDTYKPRVDLLQAHEIAGYIRPFLPACVTIDALCVVDRCAFVDKEIRKRKGQWEKEVVQALSLARGSSFRKRHFQVDSEDFEIDAAWPAEGPIELAVDVKRMEARRDIHKRTDEIVNKAQKLKIAYPGAAFGALIYYPFCDEHSNVRDRLASPHIASVQFASTHPDSIYSAAMLLVAKLRDTHGTS